MRHPVVQKIPNSLIDPSNMRRGEWQLEECASKPNVRESDVQGHFEYFEPWNALLAYKS